MGWWIALGILVLLLMLPLGVNINYDEDGAVVRVIAGPIRLTLFPRKKKDKKPKKGKPVKEQRTDAPPAQAQVQEQPAPKSKTKASAGKPKDKPKSGGSLLDFLPLVQLALKMIGDLFGKTLHIDVLYLKIVMAGDDPCDLAMNYGKTWAIFGNLWPKLDDMLTIKKRDIQFECDFCATETLITARVDLTLSLGRIFGLLFGYGFRMLVQLVKILLKRNKAANAAVSAE